MKEPLDFKSIPQPFSNRMVLNGNSYLYFGGTAYLGIPQNQAFIDFYVEGIKKFGLNNGTSRNNNIQLGIYDLAEQISAERYKSEAALITSSGYLAAQLTVKALASFGAVIYAPASHPALWLNEQPNRNGSFQDWASETIRTINSSAPKKWVLISNSMNNLFPEIYDFNFLKQLNRDKQLILIVDDSHGIGVNNNGLGSYSLLPKQENIELVVVASMAKALGTDAGLVLGSRRIINQLKDTSIFVGASPPAAAGLFAFIKAKEIYTAAQEKLNENIQQLSAGLDSTCDYTPGFPAFLSHNPKAGEELLNQHILISSFPYPDQSSPAINRIVLSTWHSYTDIEQLIAAVKNMA
jgi:7-keto-8-aminopelargonate synthetase-like enzyme